MLGRTPFRLSRAYVIPIVIVMVAVLIGAGVRILSTAAAIQPPPVSAVSGPDQARISEGGEVTVKLKDGALAFEIEPAAPRRPKKKGGKAEPAKAE